MKSPTEAEGDDSGMIDDPVAKLLQEAAEEAIPKARRGYHEDHLFLAMFRLGL